MKQFPLRIVMMILMIFIARSSFISGGCYDYFIQQLLPHECDSIAGSTSCFTMFVTCGEKWTWGETFLTIRYLHLQYNIQKRFTEWKSNIFCRTGMIIFIRLIRLFYVYFYDKEKSFQIFPTYNIDANLWYNNAFSSWVGEQYCFEESFLHCLAFFIKI